MIMETIKKKCFAQYCFSEREKDYKFAKKFAIFQWRHVFSVARSKQAELSYLGLKERTKLYNVLPNYSSAILCFELF